jgi:hypothetical protein
MILVVNDVPTYSSKMIHRGMFVVGGGAWRAGLEQADDEH